MKDHELGCERHPLLPMAHTHRSRKAKPHVHESTTVRNGFIPGSPLTGTYISAGSVGTNSYSDLIADCLRCSPFVTVGRRLLASGHGERPFQHSRFIFVAVDGRACPAMSHSGRVPYSGRASVLQIYGWAMRRFANVRSSLLQARDLASSACAGRTPGWSSGSCRGCSSSSGAG